MMLPVPDIPESQRSPLILALLDIVHQQQHIARLEDEIARLKGLPPRHAIQPSALEAPPPKPPDPSRLRPGPAKRRKNAHLTIHREALAPLPHPPAGATRKGDQDFIAQAPVFEARNARYRRERWRLPDGRALLAPWPDEVAPGHHFGPTPRAFALHQYHGQRVTQPPLLAQLRQAGIGISAGQLSRLLTEGHEPFPQGKAELLPAGLAASPYVGAGDTAARHRGHNGSCLCLGNDLFAYFEGTGSKSRLNFLRVLRQPHTGYAADEVAVAYWRRQGLAALIEALAAGAPPFAGAAAWSAHLKAQGVTGARHARIATEGALLGSLVARGVSPGLVTLSDGAAQFDVPVHASCWLRAGRPLARMAPYGEERRRAIEGVRRRTWELYQDLKAYRAAADLSQVAGLRARFDALCAWRAGIPSVDKVLQEMALPKEDLLRVLSRPGVPLHNNTAGRHIREYVTRREVSGGPRSGAGRRARERVARPKKTCRCLGMNHWEYLRDRIGGRGVVPRLAELVRRRAGGAAAGGVAAVPA
jgi:hypothetical protein